MYTRGEIDSLLEKFEEDCGAPFNGSVENLTDLVEVARDLNLLPRDISLVRGYAGVFILHVEIAGPLHLVSYLRERDLGGGAFWRDRIEPENFLSILHRTRDDLLRDYRKQLGEK